MAVALRWNNRVEIEGKINLPTSPWRWRAVNNLIMVVDDSTRYHSGRGLDIDAPAMTTFEIISVIRPFLESAPSSIIARLL